ncbi:MAG: Ada metal-binding domain-containing protein [Pseudomonadota bacterium]
MPPLKRILPLALGLCLALALAVGAAPPEARTAAAPVGAYHGNVKSKKFHRVGCRYYDCANCLAVFATREAALAAGYAPCKVCRP